MRQEQLDELWDFNDPRASEARFRAAAHHASGAERQVLLTQAARALGLQERFTEALELLQGVEDHLDSRDAALGRQGRAELWARVLLERGRVLNSSGDPGAAVVLFGQAAGYASATAPFLAADALHMLAIADPGRAAQWTERGIAVAEAADPRTRRWTAAFLNNWAWTLYDAGDKAGALRQFRRALREAREHGTPEQVDYAQKAYEQVRAEAAAAAGSADSGGRTAPPGPPAPDE
ncbi:tetratricopeptide repeat protein [Zafaria sp. Z1313]|uniref:tetratricopeptide repeat protein n=1 Tax=Zafaria sp. Z1313 TaxID=3423202 RepID=UPI003D302124